MSDYVTGIHKVTGSRDGYSTRKNYYLMRSMKAERNIKQRFIRDSPASKMLIRVH